jgi:uncharacterized protein YndB with AHSA1/START domain
MNMIICQTRAGARAAWFVGAVMIVLAAVVVRAEVVDSSDAGFTTRNTATIAAPAEDVYRHLVNDIGHWWDPEHTYSKNSSYLSLDARAGGLFLEKLGNGGGVTHMTVVFAAPGKTLRLVGGMGPLQAFGVNGSMTWQLTPEGPGTIVELVYVVGGYKPGGLKEIAPVVDKVLAEQLQRLKAYIEKK